MRRTGWSGCAASAREVNLCSRKTTRLCGERNGHGLTFDQKNGMNTLNCHFEGGLPTAAIHRFGRRFDAWLIQIKGVDGMDCHDLVPRSRTGNK